MSYVSAICELHIDPRETSEQEKKRVEREIVYPAMTGFGCFVSLKKGIRVQLRGDFLRTTAVLDKIIEQLLRPTAPVTSAAAVAEKIEDNEELDPMQLDREEFGVVASPIQHVILQQEMGHIRLNGAGLFNDDVEEPEKIVKSLRAITWSMPLGTAKKLDLGGLLRTYKQNVGAVAVSRRHEKAQSSILDFVTKITLIAFLSLLLFTMLLALTPRLKLCIR